MALTYTPTAELGSSCPSFQLPTVDGKTCGLKDFTGRPLVVMFICNHCPYVQAIEERVLKLARDFQSQVSFVAICSNDSTDHSEDSPAELLKRWREKDYGFPYLLDLEQEVARNFGAVCTPDIFVYDSSHKLRYRGRLDDSWRNPNMVKREELKIALERMLQNLPVSEIQNPSMGCSIKWKNQ